MTLADGPDLAAQMRAAAEIMGGRAGSWPTPGALARHCDPRTVQTPALDLIDAALVKLADTPDGRLIISMSPQEGKSSRVRAFVLWWLRQNPGTDNAIASYAESLALTHSRLIRDQIAANPDLGLRLRGDVSAAGEWQLAPTTLPTGEKVPGASLLAVGVGSGFTGRPVTGVLVIDDPVKDREQADSAVYREKVWSWWTDTALGRLGPGGRVVLVLTRWHHDDLAARLTKAEDGHLWTVLNIPAEADHDESKGETDPLGRDPGEFMVSARGRTPEQWQARKVASGPRTWASLYQGRPSPSQGTIFLRDRWQRFDAWPYVVRDDGSRWIHGAQPSDFLQSWDLSSKGKSRSAKPGAEVDYVVGQLWYRYRGMAYLLDQVRERADMPRTLDLFRAMHARWPQCVLKLVEDKANGPAVIDTLRTTIPGIVPVEPDGDKVSRAEAVSPLVEARGVWLPSAALAPWSEDVIEEAAAFPNGANDDIVDALSQGLRRLIIAPVAVEQTLPDYHDLADSLPERYLYSPWS